MGIFKYIWFSICRQKSRLNKPNSFVYETSAMSLVRGRQIAWSNLFQFHCFWIEFPTICHLTDPVTGNKKKLFIFSASFSLRFPTRSYYTTPPTHCSCHKQLCFWVWTTINSFFFFFYWRYNSLWVLAVSLILFHSAVSLHCFLHRLIRIICMSSSLSASSSLVSL
jgi:hypothetical protein